MRVKELTLNIPSTVFAGKDSVRKAAQALRRKVDRVMIAADAGVRETGALDRVVKGFEEQALSPILFSDIPFGGTATVVDDIADFARAGRVQGIVGVGGIRTLSAAKTAARIVSEKGLRVFDLVDGAMPSRPGIPYVEIPGPCRNPFMITARALLVDGRNRTAHVLSLPESEPAVVAIDPDLRKTLTRRFALSTILDTFLYAVEGYLSVKGSFFSDTMFLRAIAALLSAIPGNDASDAADDSDSLAAEGGLFCSLGLSASTGGPWSALAFAAGALARLPKSFCALPLIPELLEYGRKACPNRIARIAPMIGVPTEGISTADAARKVTDAMRLRIGTQELPARYTDMGISEQILMKAAESGHVAGLGSFFPVPFGAEELRAMILSVL